MTALTRRAALAGLAGAAAVASASAVAAADPVLALVAEWRRCDAAYKALLPAIHEAEELMAARGLSACGAAIKRGMFRNGAQSRMTWWWTEEQIRSDLEGLPFGTEAQIPRKIAELQAAGVEWKRAADETGLTAARAADNEAMNQLADAEERLGGTPATTLAGVLAKLRLAWEMRECSGEPRDHLDTDELLAFDAMNELERLAAAAR